METNINILEGNKLIAEFMGFKKGIIWKSNKEQYDYDIPHPFTLIKETETTIESTWCEVLMEQDSCMGEELIFHLSWDWIMPVVIKINTIEDFEFSTSIFTMDCKIENKKGDVISFCECKHNPDELIKSVWETIVNFIIWYNKIS